MAAKTEFNEIQDLLRKLSASTDRPGAAPQPANTLARDSGRTQRASFVVVFQVPTDPCVPTGTDSTPTVHRLHRQSDGHEASWRPPNPQQKQRRPGCRSPGRPSTRTKIEGEGLLLPPAPASRSEPTQQQQNEQNGLTPRRWFYNGSWQVSKFDQSFKVARPHPFRRTRNFRWTGVGYNAPQCLSTAGRFTGLSSDFVLHKLPWGFRETICILSNSTTPRLRRYRT